MASKDPNVRRRQWIESRGRVKTIEHNMAVSIGKVGVSFSDETREKMSLRMMDNDYSSGVRHSDRWRLNKSLSMVGNTFASGCVHSDDICEMKSFSMLGKRNALGYRHTKFAKESMSRHKMGNEYRLGHQLTEETKRKMSLTHSSQWADPNFRIRSIEAMLLSRKIGGQVTVPTSPEQIVIDVLDNNPGLDLVYNGLGPRVVGGKIPDFISSNGTHKILEVFGHYWHDECEEYELTAHYKKNGYDCLVLWESEINDMTDLELYGYLRLFLGGSGGTH